MDNSAVAFAVAAYVILYLVFLRLRPAVARLWLCFGGGVIGSVGLFVFATAMFRLLPGEPYGPIGLMLWAVPFSVLVGGPAGGWLVWHLTRPERTDR